jgi:CCR4-NOT transcriptional regulation complex NOT5 subunit
VPDTIFFGLYFPEGTHQYFAVVCLDKSTWGTNAIAFNPESVV